MAEVPLSDEDSAPAIKFFGLNSSEQEAPPFRLILDDDNLVPSEDQDVGVKHNGDSISPSEQELTESLDQLSTKSEQNSPNEDSDSDEHYRKKARVGNHYQARIPKYMPDSNHRDNSNEDELLWNPFLVDTDSVEQFLKRLSAARKLLIPMGTHLRDDEKALYILQENKYDVDSALNAIQTNVQAKEANGWSDEECRNFEKGLLSFGKNFFLIQKYKCSSRRVGELVQFYYLWKKTARYDLFAHKIRSGKKKYSLNPGISDLMCKYVGGQHKEVKEVEPVVSDAPFIANDSRKNVQDNVQY